MHAAKAVQGHIVTEARADNTEHVAPAPTLPSQAKVKKTAKVVPTQGFAAGKGTPSSSKKPLKGKEKESDKAGESDDDDADGETEEEDQEQVLETQQKRKRAPAAHFDVSPDDWGKDKPKKRAKTAASLSAEFKPPPRSGALQSRATYASPSETSTAARNLSSRLAKVAPPKKKYVTTNTKFSPFFCSNVCARPRALASTRMQSYALEGLYIFAELLF